MIPAGYAYASDRETPYTPARIILMGLVQWEQMGVSLLRGTIFSLDRVEIIEG
jgi:hypothetical protein